MCVLPILHLVITQLLLKSSFEENVFDTVVTLTKHPGVTVFIPKPLQFLSVMITWDLTS